MKQKIYIKLFEGAEPLVIKEQGDWIDLKTRVDIHMKSPFANTLSRVRKKDEQSLTRNVEFEHMLIPLGVGMILPKGMEAHVLPRSSTFKNYGIIQTNSCGIIDNTYCGDNDQWYWPALAMRDTHISANDRICQFRIMENQPKIHFEEVEHLDGKDRGGFGSTGRN